MPLHKSFNSDKIKDESKTTLDQIVGVLKENSDWKMTIEGHTDNIGGVSFNQALSEKRANLINIIISAFAIVFVLAEYWRPLGLDKSIFWNLIFVSVIWSSPLVIIIL